MEAKLTKNSKTGTSTLSLDGKSFTNGKGREKPAKNHGNKRTPKKEDIASENASNGLDQTFSEVRNLGNSAYNTVATGLKNIDINVAGSAAVAVSLIAYGLLLAKNSKPTQESFSEKLCRNIFSGFATSCITGGTFYITNLITSSLEKPEYILSLSLATSISAGVVSYRRFKKLY